MNKEIKVNYYAALREQRGLNSETLSTSASTPDELYREIASRYEFHLKPEDLRVSVNGSFREMNVPLQTGDWIVFIPPVAGG